MTVLASAAKFLRVRLLAWQWCGTLLLFLAACVWLQIPDSHGWQFVLSMLFGAVWISLLLWYYAQTFARLNSSSQVPIWRRMVVFVIAVAVLFGALCLIGIGREHEILYAGYWNSRLSAHARVTFSYVRLQLWQDWFYTALLWLLPAILLPVVFTAAVRSKLRTVLTSITYWIIALLAWTVGVWITGRLFQWMPGKGAAAQVMSLSGRLLVAYTVDIFLWCVVLATMAGALVVRKTDAAQSA